MRFSEVPEIVPNSRRHSLCDYLPPLEHLNEEVNVLIDCSMSTSTWKTYKTAVNCFDNFRASYNFGNTWPLPIDELAQFIDYLPFNKMSVSTVTTYLSGVSYVSTVTTYLSGLSYDHKTRNLTDYTKSFIISKMLERLRRKNPKKSDIRTPISLELLKKLISSLRWICNSDYEACMFSSAFSLAYFAMLRVSELAVAIDENGHALNSMMLLSPKIMVKPSYI
jgi:hypothetical protein